MGGGGQGGGVGGGLPPIRPPPRAWKKKPTPPPPANPAAPPHAISRAEGNGSDHARARAISKISPIAWAATTTVKTFARRVASPPLKSPEPHEREAARPNRAVMRL